MDTVQDQAASRLYKKLTALRVTLPNDERDVFDQIIPAEEEVTAHRLTNKKALRRSTQKALKSPEVTAHRLTNRKAKKASVKNAKKAAVK
jgi:hypothetical protein